MVINSIRMSKIVPTEDIKIVDANGYVGYVIDDYTPYPNNTYYNNFAIVLVDENFSNYGKGRVDFLDDDGGGSSGGKSDLLHMVIGNGKFMAKYSGSLLRYIDKTVTIGGHEYDTVVIGNQVWLAQNLDYRFQYDGANLPVGGTETVTVPHGWYYDNDDTEYGIDGTYRCGLLYNGYAVEYLAAHSSELLPEGWRVPSRSDWDESLASQVGGISVAGTRLKTTDSAIVQGFPSGWNGTDDYGMSVSPCGGYDGSFTNLGTNSYMYTSDDDVIGFDTGPEMHCYVLGKANAYSLRLVKDLT